MAAKEEVKKERKVIVFPEGRLINHSLFEKDQYDDKSTPSYKIEVAFDPDALIKSPGENVPSIEDELYFAGEEEWGEKFTAAFEAGNTVVPFLDGNVLAEKRKAKGKPGDAYAGKLVVRANTIYNKDGQDGPGGVQVFGPDVAAITTLNKDQVYQGCYGVLAATIWCYRDEKTNEYAQKFYLSAFQKTRDGEKLVSTRDHSTLFKPLAGAAGAAAAGGTRRRRG